MAEPPAGPLAARFEMMMSELLARQAAALGATDEAGVRVPERAAVPGSPGRDRTETLPPVTLRGMAAAAPNTPPRPADLGLPVAERVLATSSRPQDVPVTRGAQGAATSPATSTTTSQAGSGATSQAASATTSQAASPTTSQAASGVTSQAASPTTSQAASGATSQPPAPTAPQDERPAAAAQRETPIRSPLFAEARSRMILELGRSEPAPPLPDRGSSAAPVVMRPAAVDGDAPAAVGDTPAAADQAPAVVDDAPAAAKEAPAAARYRPESTGGRGERARTETTGLPAAPDRLGPEPESSIRSDRLAAERVAEAAAVRSTANDPPPRFDPSGLALELALLVNAEMQKGWPAARFIPLLEKPRLPGPAIDLDDEDDGSEDENGEQDEDEDKSAGYEAVLAYIAERPASRRVKKTLIFAVACYCALLHTLTTEIVEYFADLVDEDVERNHDRA
jgi:hypothetical protein